MGKERSQAGISKRGGELEEGLGCIKGLGYVYLNKESQGQEGPKKAMHLDVAAAASSKMLTEIKISGTDSSAGYRESREQEGTSSWRYSET